MLSREFVLRFKDETEQKWREASINASVYGFQFQAGTRWNSGLSDEQITAYEDALGVELPEDFHAFLRVMNGTDVPTLNVYGGSGEPSREWVGVYVYPRDLEIVRQCIAEVEHDRDTLVNTLAEEGFALSLTTKLVPIYAHRFVVCDGGAENCAVLSIWDSEDAIVYGRSLQEYLEREFLGTVPGWAR